MGTLFENGRDFGSGILVQIPGRFIGQDNLRVTGQGAGDCYTLLLAPGVQYAYDGKKKVLKGINTQMEQGKMYAILGPSGCGKTTHWSASRSPHICRIYGHSL